MDISNSFLYKILNQYKDLDKIIQMCKNSRTFNIVNNFILGNYYINEYIGNIVIEININNIVCEITYKDTKIKMDSIKTENGYFSKLVETSIIQNDNQVYSRKTIIKEMRYDLEKEFIEGLEQEEFISILKALNKRQYKINKTLYTKLDENKILKRSELISDYDLSKNLVDYSITDNFKKGIFSSGGESLIESYMYFTKINEYEYNKYIEQINEKKLKKDVKIHKNVL